MIAIKEMKMPNSCSECNLATRKTWNYACSINLKDIDCTETKRPKDCPLVEIVTCKDCKHRKKVKDDWGYYCEYTNMVMDDDEFCSSGGKEGIIDDVEDILYKLMLSEKSE